MNKTALYGLIAGVVIVLLYFGYRWWTSSKADASVTDDQPPQAQESPDFDPGEPDPSSETARSLEGLTIVNINKGNYRGRSFEKYYITYTGPGGSQVEELCNEGYTRFIVDNPSGVKEGNVILNYAR